MVGVTMEQFGPHAWQFLHYVSLSYPENPTITDKENYKSFMISIQNVLPCSICSNHYKENLKKTPLTDAIMSNKDLFIKWVIDIHNSVNKSKNKPIIGYEDAMKLIDTNTKCKQLYIEKMDNTNIINNDINIVYILYLVLIGLIFIAIVYKKQ